MVRPEREAAQAEARSVFEEYADVQWVDTLTRDEADDALGYSWSNISDIYPAGYASRRAIENAIEALKDEDYYASIDLDDGTVVVRVSISSDVFDRHS